MQGYKILITASGLGKRLGERTRYTNKALVPVGPMPAISHIIQEYCCLPREFVVTTGYCGDQVEDYLRIAHPDKKITFVPVHPYEGEGSSLAYSMWCAREHLQQPFIFHCCDTLKEGLSAFVPPLPTNWVAGQKHANPAQYRSFSVNGSQVTTFHEKGETGADYFYIGLAGITDYEAFWKALEACLAYQPADQGLSDVHVLQRMLVNGARIDVQEPDVWFDIGNPAGLMEARKHNPTDFEVLEKDDESIFMVGDKVIKFFRDQEVVANRCLRAEQLKGIVPAIEERRGCFYRYEKVRGVPLSRVLNPEVFTEFLNWAEQHLWSVVEPIGKGAYEVFERFYFTKTMRRVMEFLSESRIQDGTTTINGLRVPGAVDLIGMINRQELCRGPGCLFHGDLVLDNILWTYDGDFKLIDWRQDFGGQTAFGDRNYDLAKLNHSLVLSHKVLNAEQFTLRVDDGKVRCDVLRPHLWTECQRLLGNYLIDEPIDILTALIWLNMAPLHKGSIGRFLYYFGRYNLFKALEGRL